jgi:hypothetical protein
MSLMPDEHCTLICKSCGLKFFFGITYRLESKEYPYIQDFRPIDSMKFPKRDNSEIEIACPHCRESKVYKNEEIFYPANRIDKERELRLRENRADELQEEVEVLREEVKTLREQNTDKDKVLNEQIGNLTKAYYELAKFVHEDLPKILQGQPPTKPKTYEGTNP